MNVIAIDKLSQPLYEAFGKVCADDARAMLRYIYWDAEKGNLVATNGKSMLVCSYPNLKDKLGTETKVFTYQKGFLMEDDYLKKQGLEYVKYERVVPNWGIQRSSEYMSSRKRDHFQRTLNRSTGISW